MPVIRLPDGSTRSFDAPVSVADVAMSIGAGLAKAALAGKVNDKIVDTSFVIEADSNLAIITDKSDDGLDIIRHSAAHLLAYAVKELFPDCQVTIGPVIDNGFYYDFSYKRPFTPEDLAVIEKKMTELAKKDEPVTRVKYCRVMRRWLTLNQSTSITKRKLSRRFLPMKMFRCIPKVILLTCVAARMYPIQAN